MGGHGALVTSLRHPGCYQSVSAFSPIVAPSQVPWGQKALGAYLGTEAMGSLAVYGATALTFRAFDALPGATMLWAAFRPAPL